jgi:hypothetical protein
MNLDTFISESLKAIIKGIKDSQNFAMDNGARVNPIRDRNYTGEYVFYGSEEGMRTVSAIQFDIAVTTSSQQEAGGEGGINVFSIKLGGKLSDKDLNETVSRIKFSIDVALPNSIS